MDLVGLPVVLGIDFGGTKIAAAVCDVSGVRLSGVVVDSAAEEGARAALARGLAAGQELVASLVPNARLTAVGAATFGIPLEDRVDLAPSIEGWESLPFGRMLREAFPGVPVRTATDVKAAAVAESRWGALAGRDPGLYVNLGTGLAVAMVAGGSVVAGAHQAAGEIGYLIRDIDDVGKSNADRVILEDVISGRALASSASRRLGRSVSAAQVFELVATDTTAGSIVEEFVRELAMHVANLAVAVDPEVVVVGGGMVRSWQRIGPALRDALQAAVPFPPQLLTAAFPYDAPLIGALALGVEACGGDESMSRFAPAATAGEEALT